MSLKLRQVRSPLESFEHEPTDSGPQTKPPPAEESSSRKRAAQKPRSGGGANRAAQKPRSGGGANRPKSATKSPTQPADEPAPAATSYSEPLSKQARVTIGATLVPAIYERLEELAGDLRDVPGPRVSLTRLLMATVHFEMPADADEAIELALNWHRLRLGLTENDPFDGARTRPYTLRLYDGQIAHLDEYARALKDRNAIIGGRSLLLNAIVHFKGPKSSADALRLLRALEVEVKSLDRDAA